MLQFVLIGGLFPLAIVNIQVLDGREAALDLEAESAPFNTSIVMHADAWWAKIIE
jgi:hypothetical protein